MTAGKLMKIGDVAKRLGVAVSTVRKYEAAGVVLPVRTIGKHRLFSEDDLESILGGNLLRLLGRK